jgi:Uma2 family endonuclease
MPPTAAETLPTAEAARNGHYDALIIEDRVSIPSWVVDLASFRRWTQSDEYPETGQFAYLAGKFWVDLSTEELLTHNYVKFAYTCAFGTFLQQYPLGRFVMDRMRLSHPAADLSVEPDGLFFLWQTMQSGRLRQVPGASGGIIELEGTPDMVLEIVSATSVNKDTVRLRDLYWRAGVTEYWLVDARGPEPRFEILRHTPTGYVAVEAQAAGALPSAVLGRAFRLLRSTDPLGQPQFTVQVS